MKIIDIDVPSTGPRAQERMHGLLASPRESYLLYLERRKLVRERGTDLPRMAQLARSGVRPQCPGQPGALLLNQGRATRRSVMPGGASLRCPQRFSKAGLLTLFPTSQHLHPQLSVLLSLKHAPCYRARQGH